jgi:hypothetical protein
VRSVAPIAILILAWLMFYWRILTPVSADRLTFQQGDFTLQFLAFRQMAYRQLAQGHLPYVEECIYSGYPFQADPQSQALYPPVLVTMLLGRALGWDTYPLRALEWEVMLHSLIAALAMYAFLRSTRLRSMSLHRAACLLGALAYAYGGFMTGYAMLQTAILETAAWLPLILLALRRLARQAPRAAWLADAAVLAISVTLAFTAGHPQTLLFVVYTGAVAFVFWSWRAGLPWRLVLLRGGLAAALAIALSAVQLIPSLSFMLASTRAALPFDEAGTGFALHDIALLALTGVINVWQPLYAGIITLVLAALALNRKQPEVWLWVGIAIGALVLSFGANAMGFDLAYLSAPGYRQFHSQERHAVVVTFALGTLAAFGLNALLAPVRLRARWRLRRAAGRVAIGGGLAFAALVAIVLVVRLLQPERPELGGLSDRVAMLALGLLGTAGLLAWRARLGRLPRWLWAGAVLALLVFDVFSLDRYTATQKVADPFPPLALAQPIQIRTGLAGQDVKIARLYNHFGLPLNGACVNGLEEIGGGSPIVLSYYQTFLQRTPEDVYSRLLNVRYTVTWRGGMGTDNGRRIPDRKLASDKVDGIVANTFLLDWAAPGLSPAWIVSTVTPAGSEDALYQRLRADDYDPFGEAVIYSRDSSRVPVSGGGSAGLEGRANGYLKVAAYANTPGLLVVSEAYHWNWVAVVNGTAVRPLMVDGALLGVPIPAGASTVELSYQPLDFYAGGAISGVTLLIVLAMLLASRSSTHGSQRTPAAA